MDQLLIDYYFLQYDSQSCNTFEYIKVYQDKMNEWVTYNILTKEIMQRYILVSYWLDYRRAKWSDEDFYIDEIDETEFLEKQKEMDKLIQILYEKENDKFLNGPVFRREEEMLKPLADMKQKNAIYFKYFDEGIQSIWHYLSLVGFPYDSEMSTYFFNFVITGEKHD